MCARENGCGCDEEEVAVARYCGEVSYILHIQIPVGVQAFGYKDVYGQKEKEMVLWSMT